MEAKSQEAFTLDTFKKIAMAEGLSAIALFFIAMPLKYGFDMPLAVRYTGWVHGLLFVLYIVSLIRTTQVLKWSFTKLLLGFVAGVVPFGVFFFSKK